MPIFRESEQTRNIITLYFDDRSSLTMRVRDYEKHRLTEGDEVDLDDYIGRLSSVQLSDAYEAALSLLDYSARTESEITKKLTQKGFLPPVIEAVIDRLKSAKLVNDRELALRITESSGAKRMGAYALKRKLRARGIAEDDCDEALSRIPSEVQNENAVSEARKLIRKYHSLPAREKYAKLSQALARRGFTWDSISNAIETLRNEEDDESFFD